MKRVGLTGGIGCGKTTVVEVFKALGVDCFVADAVAANYYQQADFLEKLKGLFGERVFKADGSADKRRIADIVFNDSEALAQLNSLVHPMVMADFEVFCHERVGADYVLMESAILYESGLDKEMDSVVCVYVDMEERIRRLRLRDHTTDEQIALRIAAQCPAEEVMQKADYVILNYEGNPRARQVAYIDKLLRK